MERVNLILQNPFYNECIQKIGDWEKDRRFCGHDTNHLLHVARIAMLLNLELQLGIEKEWIYAAALLHDIGRFVQYEDGTDHAIAGALLAGQILTDAGFGEKESEQIIDAITHHRDISVAKEKSLRGILYRADKLSRDCYFCQVREECDWPDTKKNLKLDW